jgi:DNA polymerase III sliding clamp (beta) subunit (PCNA family)
MKIPAEQLKRLVRKLSVLGGDLFVFDGSAAHSSAPNLNLIVQFKTDFPIPCAVNSVKFSQLAGRLEGDVDLTVSDSKLILKTKRSKLTLPLVAEPRTPICPHLDKTIDFLSQDLLDALNFALQATQREQLINFSGSVQLGSRYAAGSDGRRLAAVLIEGGPANPLLLPVAAVNALKALDGKTVQISDDEQNIYFQSDDSIIVARKLAKNFPAFEQLIPKELYFRWKFKRDELLNALRGIAPLIENTFSLTAKGDSCILNVNGSSGSGEVQISASQLAPDSTFEDASFTGIYRHDFMIDFVETVGGDVVLGANKEGGPTLLECGNKKLIMIAQR